MIIRLKATKGKGTQFVVLLIERYNLFKFLACSNTLFHLSLFRVTFFQLHTFMLLISSKTSSQRNLDLPIGLLDMGFHLLIFFTLSSVMRSTWPNQFNLCFSINPISDCRCMVSLVHLITLDDTHTFGRTPLHEGSVRRTELYLHNTQHSQDRHPCPWRDSKQRQQASGLRPRGLRDRPLGF